MLVLVNTISVVGYFMIFGGIYFAVKKNRKALAFLGLASVCYSISFILLMIHCLK